MDTLVIEVLFPIKGREEALLDALHKLAPVVRSSLGCLQYDLFVPFEEHKECMVIMRFDSEKNLKKHEESEHVVTFVKENEGKTYASFTYSKWQSVLPR